MLTTLADVSQAVGYGYGTIACWDARPVTLPRSGSR